MSAGLLSSHTLTHTLAISRGPVWYTHVHHTWTSLVWISPLCFHVPGLLQSLAKPQRWVWAAPRSGEPPHLRGAVGMASQAVCWPCLPVSTGPCPHLAQEAWPSRCSDTCYVNLCPNQFQQSPQNTPPPTLLKTRNRSVIAKLQRFQCLTRLLVFHLLFYLSSITSGLQNASWGS